MYYSNGNYEAFANPLPPADAAKKSAYIVGGGLAGLAAAGARRGCGARVEGERRLHTAGKNVALHGKCFVFF